MSSKILLLLPAMLCSLFSKAQENKQKNSFAIAFHPIQITEDNVGLGLSYERFLNSQRSLSFYLPLSYALPVNKSNYYHNDPDAISYVDLSYPGINQVFYDLVDQWTDYKGMAYLYPGFKFYTGKRLSRVSYCLGASIVLGVGQATTTTIVYAVDTVSSTPQGISYKRREINNTTTDITRLKVGVMLTNAINIRTNKHVYTGLEVGLGYTYVNNEGSVNQQRGLLAQLGLKIGYYN